MPRKPVAPAPKARKPVAPAPATPQLDDLLDDKPTIAFPGVYMGIADGITNRSCIAYKRDEHHVWTVMLNGKIGTERTLRRWGVDTFNDAMQRVRFPHLHGPYHTVERALKTFMNEEATYGAGAYRVLSKLAKGQDPETEDSLEDILDETPSTSRPTVPMKKRKRLGVAGSDRAKRRRDRLNAMTPVELQAFRAKKNARRKMRRAAKLRN